jgi:hypothetical protein
MCKDSPVLSRSEFVQAEWNWRYTAYSYGSGSFTAPGLPSSLAA